MGALFASGWTLDQVLDLTWTQLAFVVGSVQLHKRELVTVFQDTLVACLGGKPPDRTKKKKNKKKTTESQSIDRKLQALASLGIKIEEET